MKKIDISLLMILALFVNLNILATAWEDILEGLTSSVKKTAKLPASAHEKIDKAKTPFESNIEHAQRLAQSSSAKAVEAANLSISAIKNVLLHSNNLQQINKAAEYLNNIVNGKGNSLEQVEKAKQLLHEILSEARKVERNAHEATKHIERTLRTTTRLSQHLQTASGVISPTVAKIWESLKNTATKTIPS